jgi:hypothetical protein
MAVANASITRDAKKKKKSGKIRLLDLKKGGFHSTDILVWENRRNLQKLKISKGPSRRRKFVGSTYSSFLSSPFMPSNWFCPSK